VIGWLLHTASVLSGVWSAILPDVYFSLFQTHAQGITLYVRSYLLLFKKEKKKKVHAISTAFPVFG